MASTRRYGRALWLTLAASALLLTVAACNRREPTPPQRPQIAAATATATATLTATPTSTATPTPSPSATHSPTPPTTPTATAQPVTLTSAVAPLAEQAPVAQEGAPCGLVDHLSTPIDPPLAERAYLIQGFGRGGRPAGQHAGEDWGVLGRPNLGAPVYSIGHGLVTYAQPLGWGRDKGVIIVEHRFAGGDRVLSFYGHLEPSSVALRAGDCVQRGELIARIGRPRTPPHLHFEMRRHMPDEPGPGYWPNPQSAGWVNPSQTIWTNRMANAAGVAWAAPLDGELLGPMGDGAPEVLLAREQGALLALDAQNGALRWRWPVAEGIAAAQISADQTTAFLVDEMGDLLALELPAPDAAGQPTVRWQVDLDIGDAASLAPLADGGVLALERKMVFGEQDGVWSLSNRRRMTAISRTGDVVWERTWPASLDQPSSAEQWTLAGDELVLTSSGENARIWSVDGEGPAAWPLAPSAGARFAVHNGELWAFDATTVYRLLPETRAVERVAQLDEAGPGIEAILPLADGRLLLAHRDRADRRLILLDAHGGLAWDRSYARLGAGQPSLLLAGGTPFLLFQDTTRAGMRVNLYRLDLAAAGLTQLFAGGGPLSGSQPASVWTTEEGRLMLAIPGGSVVALEADAGS